MKPETLAKILKTLEDAQMQARKLANLCTLEENVHYYKGKANGLDAAICEIKIAVAEEN